MDTTIIEPDGWCEKCGRPFLEPLTHKGAKKGGNKKKFCSEACQKSVAGTRGWYRSGKERELQNMYGLTLEEFQRMYDEQDGLCAICQQPERQRGRGGAVRLLCVDHNATTGRVRALLCAQCNLAVGNFRENPMWFEKAAEYVRRWNVEGP